MQYLTEAQLRKLTPQRRQALWKKVKALVGFYIDPWFDFMAEQLYAPQKNLTIIVSYSISLFVRIEGRQRMDKKELCQLLKDNLQLVITRGPFHNRECTYGGYVTTQTIKISLLFLNQDGTQTAITEDSFSIGE